MSGDERENVNSHERSLTKHSVIDMGSRRVWNLEEKSIKEVLYTRNILFGLFKDCLALSWNKTESQLKKHDQVH